MKKLNVLILAFLVALVCSPAFAATKADSASVSNGILSVNGVADLSSGDTQEIDSSGNAAVELKNDSNTAAIDSSGNLAVELKGDSANEFVTKSVKFLVADGAAYNGAATVYGVYLTSVTAGDTALLYDAASATGDPVLDVIVAANTSNGIYITGGVSFATDVYVDVNGSTPKAMVIYKSS